MNLFEELKFRGLIDNITSDDLIDKLNNGKLTFYIGIDPTADSLHIGHFLALVTAKRLALHGHNPVIIAGGGTGLIGDPKPNTERPMIKKEEVLKNIEGIKNQIKNIMGFETVVNNYDWLGTMNAIDFLRDFGKFFNINYMLNKDTVKRRLDIGITYTEFSYMLLQSIDFLELYERHGCTLQIGGQDQWGNITAGLELIRKKHENAVAYGLTMPLVTKSDGTKFGKSESGNVWLDINRTSSYQMYQFLYNTEDKKVIEYIKVFTFLPKEEIEKIEKSLAEEPHLRLGQKVLAKELITFIHGEKEFERALKISEALFTGNILNLTKEEIIDGFSSVPSYKIETETSIIDLLVNSGAASSKREAKEFINSGAIYLNENKIEDENYLVSLKDSVLNEFIVLKRGKKKYYLIKF